MAQPDFCPTGTPAGWLPPWEIAKAFALHTVLLDASKTFRKPVAKIVGQRLEDYIASKVSVAGGGHPQPRAIHKVVAKCKDASWFPGKREGKSTGRPAVYSAHQKGEVARVAMSLKRKNSAPTPRKVRAALPKLTRNPVTGRPMDKKTVHRVFKASCFDEADDDPWQYLESLSQDVLPDELKRMRVTCARHILRTIPGASCHHHVAIDPCYSLLPKRPERLQEQQVKAMGKKKWMSPKARRQGNNLRAPATARTQGGSDVVRVDWTPVFTRGKLHVFVCDPRRAAKDPLYPAKLTDAANLAKFVTHVLPGILAQMQQAHGWPTLPRTVVHDKASYFVTAAHDRLNATFAEALSHAGLTSWVGSNAGTTKWLAKKFGDVYLHETAISHIRRLLDDDFASKRLGETAVQFMARMRKVQNHMNSAAFARADSGRGLAGLAVELRQRCEALVALKGERLPK